MRGRREDRVGDRARVERRVAEPLEHLVLRLELVRDARAEAALVADLVGLDTVSRDLVRVGRTDALARRAELLASAFALVETIEGDVPRHEQVRALRNAQVRGRDPASLQMREFGRER